MYKAYKFRIYPNETQKILLHKSFGCVRFIYNYYLSIIKEKGFISAYDCIKDYTNNLQEEYPFLKEVDSTILRKELFHLEDNLKKYYGNKSFGFPKFKNKYSKNSYTTSAVYQTYKNKRYCNIELDLMKKEIKLPKLKKVKIRGYRNLTKINGKIVNASISKEANGKYYVSVLYKIEECKNNKIPDSIVGIDIGIKSLVTLSDGTKIENNRYIEKYEKRIQRKQKELSRKEKGSKNYYKCKQKINVLYTKLKNARKYYLHKVTKEITDRYDIIISETLKTKQMIERKKLSKEITDASFFEIIRPKNNKSEEKGKKFYQINEYYASSQICSRCENEDKKYKDLKERAYRCNVCHNKEDRDVIESINIMFEGLRLYIKEAFSIV